ncbi:MAG: cobalt-precorrin 5A hydrolase [Veillonellales bacterium]
MKLAIIAVTNHGALLASRLAQALTDDGADVYVKSERNTIGAKHTFNSLSQLISDIFQQYNGLIFIMAAGIAVRVIAPFIQSKRTDPAVVVLDDRGYYAISLLSGHLGGANELTRRVGLAIGASPVITTATDVSGLPAADVLAVKLRAKPDPFSQLKAVNAAIANNENVQFFLDCSLPRRQQYRDAAAVMKVQFHDLSELTGAAFAAAVVVTDKVLPVDRPHIFLRPPTLAIGVGCRRNTESEKIAAAIIDACSQIGRSPDSIAVIASSIVKQDEAGLLAVIKQMSVPAQFYDNHVLKRCIEQQQLVVSSFVTEQIGVGNVCEAAALTAGKTSLLLLPKTKYPQITIAIAQVN